MSALNAITVLIPTYNRPGILGETIMLLRRNLIFDGDINIFIGNDGDKELGFTSDVPSRFKYRVKELPGPKRGLGANLNMLLRAAETDIVMQMDDDHWLVNEIDVTQYVHDLIDNELGIGWIRLFLGNEKDAYNSTTYYKFQALNYGPYWYLQKSSKSVYLASNRPHIKLKAFHNHFGIYGENYTLGQTETEWCLRHKAQLPEEMIYGDGLWVTVPMFGLNLDDWAHVGDSWQGKGL